MCYKIYASFIVVSNHVKKQIVCLQTTEIYRMVPIYRINPTQFFQYFSVVYKHTICFFHKSKLWWKTHLFCKRHFFIRSIVWSLFWFEVSPENYAFLVLVITFKLQTINLIKKYLSQKRCVFHRSFDSREKNTCKFVNNWDISNYRILPNLPHKYFFEYFSVVYKHTVCFFI